VALLACALAMSVPSAPAAEPAPAGQMTWAVHFTLAPRWLDPGENEGTITPFMIFYAVHDALVKPMPAGPTTGSLAESWTLSQDGLVYDFILRGDARFHDGSPVTAEDVKFSFERYRGAFRELFKEKVSEVRAVDPRRVQFRLKEAWPDFLTFYGTTATSAGWVVPKKYVEKVGEEGFKKAPIGAGPYRVVSVNPGVEIVFEAFEGYWRKTPRVKRLVLRSLPDETTRAAALKRGDVDIAYFLTGPVAEEVRRTPGLKLMAVRSNAIFFLDFRDQWDAASPWRDARVRRAASLAVDRVTLNQAEQLGYAGLTGNVVPRGMEFALPIEPDPFDPARARQLLADAGFPRGFDGGDFTIAPPYEGAGEAIAANLAAVGIRTKIRTMERAAFFTAWREGKLKGVVFGGLGPAGNAASRISILAVNGAPYAAGVLPEVQDLFHRQARERDPRRREELLHQIQRLLHERAIFAPIWENGFIRGVGPRVEEPALSLIPYFPYSAPYEELRLKP
ncbi:MAG TPA: ABC transporter substrate-binding protein, partial [Methylomirabilota bacterium]|nr:ABC transporter substrate-binding protein [Methylomirabilota bacterium]